MLFLLLYSTSFAVGVIVVLVVAAAAVSSDEDTTSVGPFQSRLSTADVFLNL